MSEFKPTIAIIVAALRPSGGIGLNGKMPWRLRKEIRYFKDVTTRTTGTGINAVIMGRRTWESIPSKFRPLPDRVNVVLSRSFKNEMVDNNVIHANSIDKSLEQLQSYGTSIAKQIQRVFIIGGAEIYRELVNDPAVSHLLVTEIDAKEPVEVDTFLGFPLFEGSAVWEKRPQKELQSFIGDIELENDIEEGNFVYNYTLWTRK
ncbi:putative dihydrofolate reductase [Suhomyces tanzawaensis NRRL Y-17324]|uniref:Dihydrofolate reductase n=1 Tax=Suhomyces tanzawaensis NRRL Y-17324 TaxID=984487 RepID=A0A1E4SM50_9ASCO|nr:putative dihydrofolate reductase [Suhomyces tanzawaensis NRRL Y-17324]ODV80591.1 putative dihydrofolate reductase [Suhomyces tanzawaensis NRRL Y-17324]